MQAAENSKARSDHTHTRYTQAQYVPDNERQPRTRSPLRGDEIGSDTGIDLPPLLRLPYRHPPNIRTRQSRAVIPTIISQLLAGKKSIKLGTRGHKRHELLLKPAKASVNVGLTASTGKVKPVEQRDIYKRPAQ